MDNLLIPANKAGKSTDLKAEITLDTPGATYATFQVACNRLLRPDNWHKLCGSASAEFEIMDEGGKPVLRPAIQGDYIRINIPGPGPIAGSGYDWVQVALIKHHIDYDTNIRYLGMKLMPCADPLTKDPSAAHFFNPDASSTIIIRQENIIVTATYHGRNEKINNHTGSIADNVRNTVMAVGAMAGLSELQWSALIHAFLGVSNK